MRNAIRKALTKTVRLKKREMELPPSEHVVWTVYFATVSLAGLTVLELVHMIFFGSWNSEVFSAITGLIGTIMGIFLSQRVNHG